MEILSIGLSGYDVALIILCPLGAMIGSFAHAIVETIDLKGPPTNESDMRIASKELQELEKGDGFIFGPSRPEYPGAFEAAWRHCCMPAQSRS